MPQNKKWKIICLNSCTSGKYFYNAFNHGTLIFSRDVCYLHQDAPAAFIAAILAGKNAGEIVDALEATKKADQQGIQLYDYHVFNP